MKPNFDYKNIYNRIKPYLTRRNSELACLVIIILCALTLVTGRIGKEETLTLDNGNITYHGYVLANKLTGEGTVNFKNGDTYKGHFTNGVFDGKGTFTASEGWNYVGEFTDGQADGQGKLTTKTKTVYEGTFKKGIYQYED